MSRIWTGMLAVGVLVWLPGCGALFGGGGGAPPIPEPQRMAAIRKVESRFASRAGVDRNADNADMLQFIKSQPEFEDAQVSRDGCIWALFKDGELLLVCNNRR